MGAGTSEVRRETPPRSPSQLAHVSCWGDESVMRCIHNIKHNITRTVPWGSLSLSGPSSLSHTLSLAHSLTPSSSSTRTSLVHTPISAVCTSTLLNLARETNWRPLYHCIASLSFFPRVRACSWGGVSHCHSLPLLLSLSLFLASPSICSIYEHPLHPPSLHVSVSVCVCACECLLAGVTLGRIFGP